MPSDLKLASAGDRAGADLTWRQCLTRVGSFSAHAGRLWPGRDGGTVPASPWELGAQALAAARPRAIALMTAPVSGRRLSSSVAVTPGDRSVHAATPRRPRRHPPDHRPRDRGARP